MMNKLMSIEQFDEALKENLHYYAKKSVDFLSSNLGIEATYDGQYTLEKPFNADEKIFISVFYTGTVYGEFIVSVEEKTAISLLKASPMLESIGLTKINRSDIISILSENLNMISGDCISHLSKTFDQLTITAPRAIFGNTYFPDVKMASANLETREGIIQCHFYIDSMRLDISRAYNKSHEELSEAYNSLEKAMHRLQQQQEIIVQGEKMVALGKMAAGVAHEINNPLSIISITNSNIRKTLIPLETEINILSMIDRIDSTVARIAKITNGMRLFAGNVIGKDEVFSIEVCIDKVHEIVQQQLEDNKIKLIKDLQQGLFINGKREQLNEVFVQLIQNSIQEVKNISDKWIRISAAEVDGIIHIEFSDSGKGINPKIIDKIFDPFFTTYEHEKKGMGLCIVKGILNAHGANIRVLKNALNTTFVVTLAKVA